MRMPPFFRWGKYVPLAAVGCGMATLLTTMKLAYASDHIPAGMWLPFISLDGAQPPEKQVYLVGFGLTAVCIVISSEYARRFLLVLLEPEHKRLAMRSYYAALVAGAGLLGQAVVSLQPDILDVIRGKADVTLQSTIHQSSAGVLFLAGYTHCIMMDMVLHRSRVLPTTLASKRLKLVLTFTMMAPFFLAFIPHPATGAGASIDAMSWGAVGQWGCVLSLLFYFGSYYIEFSMVPGLALSTQTIQGVCLHKKDTDGDSDQELEVDRAGHEIQEVLGGESEGDQGRLLSNAAPQS